ncbi:5-oxoprolinase subunit PxpA [Sediminibacillus dalangtanensis]|uniref:5-oxoprolinase subunit A n=1 Tax=Sediminibacillus dalangtanensis TaxID=2729421 RepID=A0ABX7VWN9_9BACI|nr:5-oxoprolinase subunit PxpA [Sediminibacillus dalangtanensis]QTN00450.1 5-oxoprolinase subunit PxpA [Sediminibacillus dalangtanensis]
MKSADINCDMGESFGAYTIGNDQEVIQAITSANIACGYHAGDPATMAKTVRLCIDYEVNIGAHPALPDLIGFGRRSMQITPDEAYQLIIYQTGALSGFVKAAGSSLSHVKPHGALYNMAAKDHSIAESIAQAVFDFDSRLTLFALSGSALAEAGKKAGLHVAHEVFADRTYQEDGSLTPRSEANALITDENRAIDQVMQMLKSQTVTTVSGKSIPIIADTICIHGDSPQAPGFAQKIHAQLRKEGFLL